MIVIKRSRKYPFYFIKASDLSNSVIEALDSALSYYPVGYEYADSYMEGAWDGKVRLLKWTKNGDYVCFPVGLIDIVRKVLDKFGIGYIIKDISKPEGGVLNLEWHGPTLRLYQKEAVAKALEKERGVISLPTGAGKTLIALRLIYLLGVPTLIVVHRKELLYQWHSEIKEVLDYEAGIVGDGRHEFKPITVGMMQTLRDLDLPQFDALFFDEAHHCSCNLAYAIATRCNAYYRFGLSATPYREDGADLKIFASTGEVCVNITAEDLIDQGYLAKPRFIFLDPPPKPIPWRYSWHKVYREGIVRNEGRNNLIVKVAKMLSKEGLRVYIHVERIDHGKLLAEKIGCPFLCGRDSSKKRQTTLQAFEEGKIRILVSTLLGEGVDIPSMNAIILAHGYKTSIGTIQKIGRALRVAEGKEEAIIVDFNDKGKYLYEHSLTRKKVMKEYYGKYFRVSRWEEEVI